LSKIIPSEELVNFYKKGFFPMAESAASKLVNLYQPKKRFLIPINNFHIPEKII